MAIYPSQLKTVYNHYLYVHNIVEKIRLFINARREGDCDRICLSVSAPFCPYNSKTITSIEFKFGRQIVHGVQTDSSKFGKI